MRLTNTCGAWDFRPDTRFGCAQEPDAPSGGVGRYAKKTLTLTVCEMADVSGRNPSEVGSIVLNLAEFASLEGTETERRVPLATSSAISAAVGQPMLFFTIRRGAVLCRVARALAPRVASLHARRALACLLPRRRSRADAANARAGRAA